MTTTTTSMPVWMRGAMRCEHLPAPGIWTWGAKDDRIAVWAAGPASDSYRKDAEPGAVAVVYYEWRKPEAFADDDLSAGGFYLLPDGATVRQQDHASVFCGGDGLVLGRWSSGGKTPAAAAEVREWK
jgi:hypothetical protein